MNTPNHPRSAVAGPRLPEGASARNPSTLSKMPCLECNGAGEAEYMGLNDSAYSWQDCHACSGTGLVAPYCEVCEGKLTVDGFCYSCDDWGSLVFVERISPTRIAL